MKKSSNRGYTLTELVIVLSTIAIISAVLIPHFVNTYKKEKAQIIDIYNGQNVVKVDEEGNILESTDGYNLVGIEAVEGVVVMRYVKGGDADANLNN